MSSAPAAWAGLAKPRPRLEAASAANSVRTTARRARGCGRAAMAVTALKLDLKCDLKRDGMSFPFAVWMRRSIGCRWVVARLPVRNSDICLHTYEFVRVDANDMPVLSISA